MPSRHHKGQLNSKCLFFFFNFYQRTNENKSTFVRFVGELRISKSRFEIKWPLAFENFFLFWVPTNINKDLKTLYYFISKYSKITVWKHDDNFTDCEWVSCWSTSTLCWIYTQKVPKSLSRIVQYAMTSLEMDVIFDFDKKIIWSLIKK